MANDILQGGAPTVGIAQPGGTSANPPDWGGPDGAGALIALFALLLSIWSIAWGVKAEKRSLARVEAAERRSLAIAIWQQWVSQDFRAYRVVAWDALRETAKPDQLVPIKPVAEDRKTNEALGSIEHFIEETAKIAEAGMLDRTIFDPLFRQTFVAWAGILYRFDRTGADVFSHDELKKAFNALLGPGHEAEALEDFRRRNHPPR